MRGNFRSPKIYQTTPVIRKGIYISPKLIFAVLILAAVGYLIYFVFLGNFFRIKEIIIEGTASEESKTEINQLKNKNILLFGSKKIEKRVTDNEPGIFSIAVLRGIPDTLRIKIQDREAKMVWESQGKTFLVDEIGVVFIRPSVSIKGLPYVIDTANLPVQEGQQVTGKNFISFVKELKEDFVSKTGLDISKMQIGESTFNLEVFTSAGFKVIFDTTREAGTQLEALAIILRDHRDKIKEYADVRVEGWGYYK